jgi:uncharacterized protein YlzI (FlbEa/FlbD family)
MCELVCPDFAITVIEGEVVLVEEQQEAVKS